MPQRHIPYKALKVDTPKKKKAREAKNKMAEITLVASSEPREIERDSD